MQYFLFEEEYNNSIMTEFLHDMIAVSECMEMAVTPIEIVKEVMGKCGLEGSPYNAITQIASGVLLDALSAHEIFTLLWFVSCKNVFTYEEQTYLRFANNGVIGRLLSRLS